MHPDDAMDEAQVALMKAQILAAMNGDAKMTMKVYALLEAASEICSDSRFLGEAFSEVLYKRVGR